jgi:hypothetical protein
MAVDFKKLTNDLQAARDAALKVKAKDQGSFSADRVCLSLPRTRESKVLALLKSVGLSAYKSTAWAGCYMIGPPGPGVASLAMKKCEKMAESLKASGWDAGVFYKMD